MGVGIHVWHLEDVVFHGMTYRPLVSHLVLLGRNETQRVASIRRNKQRDTCWEVRAQSHMGRHATLSPR